MPDFLPFVALFLAAFGGAWLLVDAYLTAREDWSPERDTTQGLRLIHGDRAEVHEIRRSG